MKFEDHGRESQKFCSRSDALFPMCGAKFHSDLKKHTISDESSKCRINCDINYEVAPYLNNF